jgi:inner membrane protein
LALGIVAGSVLPDLDALYRLANTVAFLPAHQTWSHALPVHLALSTAAGAFAVFLGRKVTDLTAGLLTGLLDHSLLDLTNTYGVAWFIPFSRRRFYFEWVFFINAVVFTSMAIVLAALIPI